MDSSEPPVASGSSLQRIQIFSPGTQLETSGAGFQAECETAESKTDHDRASSAGKRKRARQSLKSGGESSESYYHRQYPAKKAKQNDDDVYMRLHPLQDYLQHGLDGTSFLSSNHVYALRLSLGNYASGVLWNQVGG